MDQSIENMGKPLAVVTGASSGIGYELAKQFALNGFDLVVVSEDTGIVEAAQAFQGLGAKVVKAQIDLAKEEGVERFYQEIVKTGRAVDAIAINAGVGVGGDFVRQTDLRKELNLIDLNVRSSVHLAKLVLPEMVKRGEGRVLFTSSIAATMPGPFEACYAASKAFLLSFSEALRNELKETGVTVTALMPGPTETNFFHRADMDNTKVGADKKDDAGQVAKQGFDALMSGKDKVVAGSFMNAVQATIAKFLPQTTTAQIHRGMSEPGSAAKV